MNLLEFGEAGDFGQGVYNYYGKIGFLTTSAFDPALVLAIDTQCQSSATITFDIMTIRNPYAFTNCSPPPSTFGNRILQIDLQYRVVGQMSSFVSVSGNANGIYETAPGPGKITAGDTSPQNLQTVTLTLPPAALGWSNVQLRWVQRQVSGCGSRPTIAVDNVRVEGVGGCCVPVPNLASLPAVSGECSATVTAPTATSNCYGQINGTTTDPLSYTAQGTYTVHWNYDDGHGNVSHQDQAVEVKDITPPTISAAGAETSVECPANPVFTAPTATDNCVPNPQVIEVGDVTTAGACAGVYNRTKTWKARDASGKESGTVSQTIHVVDTTPPVVSCPTLPGLTAGANCQAAVPNVLPNVTASDGCCSVSLTQSPAAGTLVGLGNTLVTVTATDPSGNSSSCSSMLTVSNPPPVATITGPASGALYAVNTPVTFSGAFTDNAGDTHTATWLLDGTSVSGTVNEAGQSVSASYTFTAAGVYMVSLTVTDQCGGSSTATQVGGLDAMVVVYDPNAGFVTGGGWINSPAGAFYADQSLTGIASFGFVSKYKKGASTPTGETEFQYKVGGLNFHSSVYEWLVVSGGRAQYKGSGTINGAGDYGFLLTAIDGAIAGGADRFRMKISTKGTNSIIVYDNQLGASDGSNPTTVLGGGSIVIHTSGGAVASMRPTSGGDGGGVDQAAGLPRVFELSRNLPNPFGASTQIWFGLPERSWVTIQVYDVLGRQVNVLTDGEWAAGRQSIAWSGETSMGGQARAGLYLVRMTARSLDSGQSYSATRRIALVR